MLKEFADNILDYSDNLSTVVSACKSLLNYSPLAKDARIYLSNRLSSRSIDKYNIGFFPADEDLSAICDLVKLDKLIDLNIVYKSGIQTKSVFNNHNIIFPHLDEYGNIVALSGRTRLNKDEQKTFKIPKYKNLFYHKTMHLFGLYQAKRAIELSNCVNIVEGQIDVIQSHDHGFLNTVAVTGSDLSLFQAFLLRKYTTNFNLLFDNDKAGDTAMTKIIKNYDNFNITRSAFPQQYNDVDEYLSYSVDRSAFRS